MCRGYQNLTLLDISQAAIEHTTKRLGMKAKDVTCIAGDVLEVDLPKDFYGVWHDRAVFHFLTERIQRLTYLDQVSSAVTPGGHIVVGTFGPEGPQKCSGLAVQRYCSESLQVEFGSRFHLIESSLEMHQTPFGTEQQFLYCHFCLLDGI